MTDELETGSWAEWRRLVLSEQRRITHDLRDMSAQIRLLTTAVELLRASSVDAVDLEKRVSLLEAEAKAGADKNEDRKWLIGLAVLVIASIAFPSLRVLLFGGGGG